MNINKLIVHHSASKKSTTKDEIEKWHKDRGFNEIGYHMVIGAKGVHYQGRSENKVGAHAKGANSDSLGVCVTGNFENDSPDMEQIHTLIEVLAGWCKKYGLDEIKVFGHYNAPGCTTATSCPGKNLKSKLNEIKLKVKEKIKNT
jgi:N-acetylmuramoyl-L-alanine amidase